MTSTPKLLCTVPPRVPSMHTALLLATTSLTHLSESHLSHLGLYTATCTLSALWAINQKSTRPLKISCPSRLRTSQIRSSTHAHAQKMCKLPTWPRTARTNLIPALEVLLLSPGWGHPW